MCQQDNDSRGVIELDQPDPPHDPRTFAAVRTQRAGPEPPLDDHDLRPPAQEPRGRLRRAPPHLPVRPARAPRDPGPGAGRAGGRAAGGSCWRSWCSTGRRRRPGRWWRPLCSGALRPRELAPLGRRTVQEWAPIAVAFAGRRLRGGRRFRSPAPDPRQARARPLGRGASRSGRPGRSAAGPAARRADHRGRVPRRRDRSAVASTPGGG